MNYYSGIAVLKGETQPRINSIFPLVIQFFECIIKFDLRPPKRQNKKALFNKKKVDKKGRCPDRNNNIKLN